MDTENGTPAERELRQAKSSVATLNHLVAEAEKGAALPYAEIESRMASTRLALVELSHGRVPQASTAANSGTVSTPNGFQASTVHARAGGQQTVTDIQRRTAQQLLAETNVIEASLQRYQRKYQKRQNFQSEVEQLLGSMGRGAGQDNLTDLQHLNSERNSLRYTHTRVQAMLDESNVLMKALQDQGSRLEGSGSKVADMLESLGVANTTILHILRRNKVDAWLVYGGIAICILIMYYIW